MLQREVAERVAAAPGSRVYGSMSVLTQIACDVRLAFGVPPGAFTPPPQVDSAVIHLRVAPAARADRRAGALPRRRARGVRAAAEEPRQRARRRARRWAPSALGCASPPPASTPAAAPRRSRSPSSRASTEALAG